MKGDLAIFSVVLPFFVAGNGLHEKHLDEGLIFQNVV